MNPAAALWKNRLTAHLKIVSRYTAYAGQSGFFLFLLIVFIASSYFYGKALERIPETFPYAIVIALWLTPFIAVSPIRTLLREADLIFLLPMEARMGPYFRGAMLYSYLSQSFLLVVAFTASMPLYRHGYGENAQPFLALLLFALALKFANMLGAWTESAFVRTGHRVCFRICRFAADAVVLYALYRYEILAASIVLLAAIGAAAAWARLSRRIPVNWPYLRRKEAGHRLTMLLFFNGFIDVEELPSRVKPRRLLSGLAGLVPFRASNAFRYLYSLTLLRSELFGITMRITLLAVIILLFVESPVTFAVVYMLFQVMTNVQLSALGRFHRHSVWTALYPIPGTLRRPSAARIAFIAQLVQIAIMTLPLFRPAVFTIWLLALPLLGVSLAWIFRMRGIRAASGHSE
ncbi:ABC transporter permease [Paenibacillus sp. GYB004]|uniref:ABC transporter permease n=1 Tax=Paenibacillus sp. GYB004 TaxID=2994393 RepID=UPI002F961D78